MSKQIKIGVLGASFKTGNLGVGALACGSFACLLQQWPKAEVFICDYAQEPSVDWLRTGSRSIPIKFVNIRFSKKLFLPNNIAFLLVCALVLRLLPSEKLRKVIAAKNSVLQQIASADFMASIAGGDSFSDIYGLRRLLYVSLPQILVILMGKKLVLLPQTFGPFRSAMARCIARFIIANAESAYTRDRNSLPEIDRMFPAREGRPVVRVRYDVAFALEPYAPVSVRLADEGFPFEESPWVGLNISGLLYMGGYDRQNMFGLQGNYSKLVEQIVRLLVEDKKVPVLLIPHVFGGRENVESDVVACNEVFARLKKQCGSRLGVLSGEYDQSEIKHIIGRADFFIGSRMHACIAALSQGVPSVSIAYSDKFTGVLDTVGLSGSVADARKLNFDEILQFIVRAYDGREAMRAKLAASMPAVTTQARALFSGSLLCGEPEPIEMVASRAAKTVVTSHWIDNSPPVTAAEGSRR